MNDLIIKENWLIENPTARVPIVLCLDCSPSMSGKVEWGASSNLNGIPIDELNEGVQMFFNSIRNDEIAKMSAEISIVAFSSIVEKILDFDYIENILTPTLELEMKIGGTSIGKAVKKSIEILEQRKKEYSDAGVDYYQPWLVILTDGAPTDDTHIEISKNISVLVNEKKLTIFPIAIGDDADLSTLKMFSPKRAPLKLNGLNFKEFFEWLSQSVSRVSASIPGENIELDIEGIKGWAEL